MHDAIVVIDGARTPVGSFGGELATEAASSLGSVAIRGALTRSGVSADLIDEVVFGCVGQVGPEAFNARMAALGAGLPVSSGAMNVNRLCGSGLQALWSAASEIMLGQSTIVIAGGNESMSGQPFLDYQAREGHRLGDRTALDGTLSLVTDPWKRKAMGVTAENVAERFGISRVRQDEFAFRSQSLATAAQDGGVFAEEIVPVTVKTRKGEAFVDTDGHIRRDVSIDKLASLRPVFRDGGSVTAGNSSGINDGAAALVLMRESQARELGLEPRARIVAFAKSGNDPDYMGYAPVGAIAKVLRRSQLALSDMGTIELNEAFAAQALAVIDGAGLDESIVNPRGGAIALGHPLGATGAILALRAIYDLRRLDVEYSMVTLCIGGGQGVAMIFQSLD